MSSVWEKKSVVLIGDGIEVEKDASSSWVLYWTGNGYDTYFTSD
jgi:hypothetical protein